MAKLTAAELSKKLQTAFPDDTSDNLLEIMGDIADSVGDMDFSEERAEYEKKLQAKDAEWKQKFIDRFVSGKGSEDPPRGKQEDEDEEPEDKDPETYEDLFVVVKE